MNDNRFGRRSVWEDMDQGPSAVRCKIDSFAQFSRWLDGELAKLERAWPQRASAPRTTNDTRIQKPKAR